MIIGVLLKKDKIRDWHHIFMLIAQSRGHIVFCFKANDVDFDNKKILGSTLSNGKIIEKIFDFPDVVRNVPTRRNPHDRKIVGELVKIIPFTCGGIKSKSEVNLELLGIPELKKYALPVARFQSFEDIKSQLLQHQKIILKPRKGNHGKGIYSIKMNNDDFGVVHSKSLKIFNNEELMNFTDDILKDDNKIYDIYPFFDSCTNTGLTTAFRLTLMRGENGRWNRMELLPNVNIIPNQNIVNAFEGSLLSKHYDIFLDQFYPNMKNKINEDINFLVKNFYKFQKLYKRPFDEVGLDLGIDQQANVVIFEINVAPGTGLYLYESCKNSVDFCEYLYKNNSYKTLEISPLTHH